MGGWNIPLAVNPAPQNPGPMDLAQKGLNVQALINATQLQKQTQAQNALKQQSDQIELEQQQQGQKDQETFNKAFHDAGGDWDQTIKNATQAGASGAFITKAQLARTDQVTKLATANKDLLANEQTKADQLAKDALAVRNAPADEQASLYASLRNKHIIAGTYKPNEIPEQLPSNDELDATVAHSTAAQAIMKDAADLREKNAKLPGEQAKAKAEGYATGAQTMNGANEQLSWTARRNLAVKNNPDLEPLIPEQYSPQAAEQVRQLGIAPKDLASIPLDKVEEQAWLKKNPGKDAADFMAYKAKLIPQFNFNLSNNSGANNPNATPASIAKSFGMTQEAFDQAAEKYAQTGNLPPVGRGPNGIALQRAIMNRTGELHGGESLAANSSEYKANTQSLGKLQGQFDNVSAFENTAIKNLDQVVDAGKSIPDLGARFANVPVRMINAQMIGTPEMARFRTALLTAQTEAAKVLSSANASGVLSDSARHETQEILDGNLSFPAMMASINQLKTDMANRHQSYGDQIQDIQKRLGAKAPQQQNSTSTPAKNDWASQFGGVVRNQ
jgi:hypothetical protein